MTFSSYPAIAQTAASDKVEEIIVTAQKREQSIQNVPISITALSRQVIDTKRVHNVLDLNAIAPNLTVRQSTGAGNAPNYTLRGIAANNSIAGASSGVSVYIDGVYANAGTGSAFDLADIERIEVLKGPQGTLFGRNVTGGAISIITRGPLGEFHVEQNLTYGNYDQFRSKTRVDLPRFGPFTAALTYLHNQREGEYRNLGAGTTWDYGPTIGLRTSPKRLGDSNAEALQGTLRMQPSSSVDIVYKFDYSQEDVTDKGEGIASFGSIAGGAGIVQAILAAQPAANLANLTPITSKRPDAVNNAFTTPGDIKNSGHALTVNFKLDDTFSFKNIAAYRKTSLVNTSQLDGFGGLVTPAFISPLVAGQPFLIIGNDSIYRQTNLSNESQVNVTTRWFKLTGGALWYRENLTAGGLAGVKQVLSFTPVVNFVLPQANPGLTHIRSISTAVFAQGEIKLTDQIDLVTGIRQTWDHKSGIDTAAANAVPFNNRSNKPTWLAGLNYKPTNDILVYAKASTGYISGGVKGGQVFAAETARSYEAGVKADMFDRTLRTNLSVFRADYVNQQIATLVNGVSVILNAGKSRAWGGEFEGTLIPITGVTLQTGIGYTNFKYLRLDPAVGIIGQYFPANRPKLTGNASAQYQTPPMDWGGRFLGEIDGQYRSKSLTAPQPTSAAIRDAITAPRVLILNGRVGVTDIPLGNVKAQVAFWGRNLTNNRALSYTVDIGFAYSAVYERARTYGLDVRFEL